MKVDLQKLVTYEDSRSMRLRFYIMLTDLRLKLMMGKRYNDFVKGLLRG